MSSFLVPNGPLIPGSDVYSSISTTQLSANSVTLTKTAATNISSSAFDTITVLNSSQGIITITFQSAIPAGTASPKTMTFEISSSGPSLTDSSLIFFSNINTQNITGIPYVNIQRILPEIPGVFNGEIITNLVNIDGVNDINEDDVVVMGYLIIS
jgi:hypothetical protein